ncbi:unnamed protein product [Cylindrotheca closterium]|uniref:Uncharacterized protein n=1 Tax=Cylindrotheca closterium TaxID=2856 RepID=A0AAD2JGC3_9STRA|nr:unnamed protein product [Cylindrotheca closterium]
MSTSHHSMGFFENAFGFNESNYSSTQKSLLDRATFSYTPPNPPTREYWQEHCSFHVPNGDKGMKQISAGTFSMPSVEQLRSRVQQELDFLLPKQQQGTSAGQAENNKTTTIQESQQAASKVTVRNMVGEARSLHSEPFSAILGKTSSNKYPPGDFPPQNHYIFQAASQFNLLEFPSPRVTPEAGIAGYINDRTQGPACAIACAAGTAYRNYLLPMMKDGDSGSTSSSKESTNPAIEQRGQTKEWQLNGLQLVEDYLKTFTSLQKVPWTVHNGYMEGQKRYIMELNALLESDPHLQDALTSRLQIGVQEDATVTDCCPVTTATTRTTATDHDDLFQVTQTYNSAISIGYSRLSSSLWRPMATIVLQATYEATLLVAILKAIQFALRGDPKQVTVLLTKVGGGVFQNDDCWICEAMKRAIGQVEELITSKPYGIGLDVRIVHFGEIQDEYMSLEQ